jgi:hypothetical protein
VPVPRQALLLRPSPRVPAHAARPARPQASQPGRKTSDPAPPADLCGHRRCAEAMPGNQARAARTGSAAGPRGRTPAPGESRIRRPGRSRQADRKHQPCHIRRADHRHRPCHIRRADHRHRPCRIPQAPHRCPRYRTRWPARGDRPGQRGRPRDAPAARAEGLTRGCRTAAAGLRGWARRWAASRTGFPRQSRPPRADHPRLQAQSPGDPARVARPQPSGLGRDRPRSFPSALISRRMACPKRPG